MFTWKTKNNTQVRLIKVGITNCYLIEKNDLIILVDTGQKRKSELLKSQLSSLLGERNLDYLILTHTHYDHAENALMVKQKFSPKIIVHESEADFLQNGFTKLPKGTNIITNFISGLGNRFARKIGEYNPVKADITANESYTMENINGIEIIHTPGHTIGSISIIIDNEIALVGDTLFGIFTKSVLPPFADDKKLLIESWRKLLKTNCLIFLPAHGKRIKRNLLENQWK